MQNSNELHKAFSTTEHAQTDYKNKSEKLNQIIDNSEKYIITESNLNQN